MLPKTAAPLQIRWTIPTGNGKVGLLRLERWKSAARKAFHDNPKMVNAWIRQVLDAEARRILQK